MEEQFEQDIGAIRIKAIETVIEYLYYDEKKHFEEVTGFEEKKKTSLLRYIMPLLKMTGPSFLMVSFISSVI